MYDEKTDARKFINKMEVYLSRIDKLWDAITLRPPLSPDDKAHARVLFKSLKADIKAEAHEYNKVSADEGLTPIEQLFYKPGICKASANFLASAAESPDGQRWKSTLYDIKGDIDYFLAQLKERFPGL
jgi:hypothetical protein